MSQTITIFDESLVGKLLHEIHIQVNEERTTVREIITARVSAEVEKYNADTTGFFTGLIQPSDAEVTLNGFKLKKGRQLDIEKQVYVALDAFKKNGYFILIDNLQADELSQEVLVTPATRISFVKLTPLVGG